MYFQSLYDVKIITDGIDLHPVLWLLFIKDIVGKYELHLQACIAVCLHIFRGSTMSKCNQHYTLMKSIYTRLCRLYVAVTLVYHCFSGAERCQTERTAKRH